MIDYVSVSLANVASAVDSASAYTILTIAQGTTFNGVRINNGFNVDMVVIFGAAKPVYLRAGDWAFIDLKANQEDIGTIGGAVAVKTYAAAGVAASASSGQYPDNMIVDCMFR